jgi:hypothetical protein
MRIDASSSRIGIGTASPGRQLSLYGEAVIRLDGNAADPGIDFNTSGTSDMQIRYRGSTDKLQVYSYGTSTNVMTIQKSNGYIGIGTESPESKLHIEGLAPTIILHDTDTTISNGQSYGAIQWHTADGSMPGTDDIGAEIKAIDTAGYGDRAAILFSTAEDATALTERMRIASSGVVGIGATNPVEKLCVRSTATYATSIEYDASTRLRIGVAGSGVATFTTDIKPLDNALDKVLKISGVEFDWNDTRDEDGKPLHSYKGHDVGVIAQEIEKVLPEVVTTRDNGYKAVKYEKIVPLLIEAIKEQQEQIDELRKGNFVIETGD